MQGNGIITRKTVLILGAGASGAQGYPVGNQFRQDLLEFPSPSQIGYSREANISDADLKEFRERFRYSKTDTVDEFLRHNPSIRPTGKKIIAGVLIENEHLDSLMDYEQGWYQYLWQRLREDVNSIEELKVNKLSVITFNYDRSLEAFLSTAIHNSFEGCTQSDIREVLTALGIHHLHGCLGDLDEDSANYRPYTYKLRSGEDIINAAEGITLPYEERRTPIVEKAQKIILKSDCVIFLGFGYWPVNMEKLSIPVIGHPQHTNIRVMRGTGRLIPDWRRERLQEKYNGLEIDKQGAEIQVFLDRDPAIRGLP